MTFNQYWAKAINDLKITITKLANFFQLYTPENKYDICLYWQLLEYAYDPVTESAKACEIFVKRYHPSVDDMFQIFIQFARFFKEFADFETEDIPIFRHPPILGGEEV